MQAFSIDPSRSAAAPIMSRSIVRHEEAAQCRLALAIAAAAFDIASDEMCARSRRKAPVADARHVAIYLAHIVFQLPMQAVADGFGRDRTSVGHALRRVEDRRDDPGFDARLERLERLAQDCRAPDAPEGDG